MNKLAIISLFYLLGLNCFAQQIMWDREWAGGQGLSSIFSNITVNADTSIVVSGVSILGGGNGYPAHWVKYDKNGSQLWQKYGRVMWSGEQDIISYGTGYLFAGTQKVPAPAGSLNRIDIGLHWLDSNGDTLTNIRYGSPLYTDFAIKILPVQNDIYVLGLTDVDTYVGGLRNPDYSLLKLGNNGTTQRWFKTYGTPATEYASCLLYNSRGNLVISGISQYQNLYASAHPYLFEVDTSGAVIRTKMVTIKNAGLHEYTTRMFHNIAETADGNYIMSGSIELSSSPKIFENFIAKLDAAFNVLWVYSDAVQTSFYGFSKVQQLSNGSYAVLMHGDNAIPGDYHIVKVSATGQFISRTTYNSPITGNVRTYDWKFLGDGSVLIAGQSWVGKPYIARLGNVGMPAVVSSVAEPIAREARLGQSYPNPAAQEATIPYDVNPGVKEAELRIYEVATGRIIQVLRLDVKAQQINLDLKPIRQGVYSYTLFEDGMPAATRKMVVMK